METGARIVIADMEAGVGNLTRMREGSVDILLVVVEPSARSIEVARRAREIARDRAIGPVRFAANRVRDAGDRALIEDALGPVRWQIADDDAIHDADREGRSPLDAAPASRAVADIAALAAGLVPARA